MVNVEVLWIMDMVIVRVRQDVKVSVGVRIRVMIRISVRGVFPLRTGCVLFLIHLLIHLLPLSGGFPGYGVLGKKRELIKIPSCATEICPACP
jgi:hypothetical protein